MEKKDDMQGYQRLMKVTIEWINGEKSSFIAVDGEMCKGYYWIRLRNDNVRYLPLDQTKWIDIDYNYKK